ncbi:MAG: hypothetical protein FWG42_07745 [Clostridiales bacterium]|nr:hypothetical protein [Clostridiales bacterium]
MSYSSKKTIASIVAGVFVVAAYITYALSKHSPAPDNLKLWATAMLVFIGMSVAAVIAVQIIFHVVFAVKIAASGQDQGDETVERLIASTVVEDERDRLVGLRSARIGYIVTGAGLVAMLAALAFGLPTVAALHILLGATSTGSLAEGIASVYFYERGVSNG